MNTQQKLVRVNNDIDQAKLLAEYFAQQRAPRSAAVSIKRYKRLVIEREKLWQQLKQEAKS